MLIKDHAVFYYAEGTGQIILRPERFIAMLGARKSKIVALSVAVV
ncbi:hypothetical protein [Parageobacillus thermoglucosidasius]|nr:hypothetical protein [Parageobacillus thermoglucosidasius]